MCRYRSDIMTVRAIQASFCSDSHDELYAAENMTNARTPEIYILRYEHIICRNRRYVYKILYF